MVTALGLKREEKALGYAVTEVKGDELKAANTISPVAALQGKVAGVEISGSDGGLFGGTKIQIRGASTLSSNNQPIYVVDGVIFDSEILVLQAWKEVAERHGIAGVEAACHECLGTNSVVSKGVFLKHYGEDFPYEEYKAEMAEVFFSHASGGKLAKKPGVEELLKYLKMRGFKIGLASSTREVLVRSEISDGNFCTIQTLVFQWHFV